MFEVGGIGANFTGVAIIMSPTQRAMSTFTSLYKANEKKDIRYWLIFCPKKSPVCIEVL